MRLATGFEQMDHILFGSNKKWCEIVPGALGIKAFCKIQTMQVQLWGSESELQ